MLVLFGIIFIILGLIISIKFEWMLKFFGYNSWAENKLASWGGSRSFYKLLGIALIILGLFIATNLLNEILLSLFSPIAK